MVTPLLKPLKRELRLKAQTFVLTVSPESLKLTAKGRRKGYELRWEDLVSGDAALATALNASLGRFATSAPAPRAPILSPPAAKEPKAPRGRGAKARARR
jgi:hypothetical protein